MNFKVGQVKDSPNSDSTRSLNKLSLISLGLAKLDYNSC